MSGNVGQFFNILEVIFKEVLIATSPLSLSTDNNKHLEQLKKNWQSFNIRDFPKSYFMSNLG